MRFSGKTAMVTGASSGIGLAAATRFVREGARVLFVDLRDPGEALEEVRAGGGEARYVRADVTRNEDVQTAIDACVDTYGGIDILYNNAGFAIQGSAADLSLEDWNRVFNLNVTGVFLGCKLVLPRMVSQGGGVIVNTASSFGLIAQPKMAAYCASKSAVVGLTRQIALDYARYGVRCNCVCPGPTFTPNIQSHYGPPDKLSDRGRYLLSTVPLGRMARPEEIAAAVLFLASEDASFVTGSALVVDGGQSIHTGPVWRDAENP